MTEETFKVRYYETDARGALPLWALQNYFQETAGIDAHKLSFGAEELGPKGVAWALTKMQFKFSAPAVNQKSVKVKTWHHICEKVQSRREFIIYGQDGQEIVKGITWWIILDLEKRKIMRTPQGLMDLNASNPPAVMEANILKAPAFDGIAPLNSYEVIARLEDIDSNGHVNNVHFSAWALGGVPAEVYQNKRLDDVFINFKNEVMLGDKIAVNTYAHSEAGYWHILTRPDDGKEIAAIYTSWK
ncbi:MAG: hypothetical protein LBR90_01880 [Elusimicrobiota bacterium]|jgi:medium-chain acyl-[acyl-carrier-protein] hydrolase|nr:hypothetical protein [Elusimicrobiota bacterium]